MPARARVRCLAALAAATVACAAEGEPPNLLLVSIDTLRADHVGSYGYARDTTPRLDALAARSRRYAEAWAPTPWTLPSHAALLTGRHPWALGVVDHRSALPANVPLLAERLAAAGYATAAFVDSAPKGFVGARRGFDRGFARYAHAPHPGGSPYRHDAAKTVDAALRWLDDRPGSERRAGGGSRRPFFLFLHTKTVHATSQRTTRVTGRDVPYDTPDPQRARFLEGDAPRHSWRDESGVRGVSYLRAWNRALASGERRPADFGAKRREELVALYDAGIAYVDRELGRLLEGLRDRGLAGSTVAVVVADHGEAFLEHRLLLHKELYRPLLRVPLIVHDPRAPEGVVVETPVALRDVAPTLLELADLRAASEGTARVLPREDAGGKADREFFAFYTSDRDRLYEGFALRRGPLAVLHHRFASDPGFRTDVFDVQRDPEERRPLGPPPEEARSMRRRLAVRMERGGRAAPTVELDPETLEGLRALGYVD